MTLTNLQLIQYLADGFKINEIAKETGINNRTLEKRVITLRRACLAKTTTQLIATYFRKNLIN